MADAVVVRDLEPGDVEAVVDIAVAAWGPIFASFRRILGDELFAAHCPDPREEKARQVRSACQADSRALVCVAELDGRVVGFATFYPNVKPGLGEIGNNAVHPDYQGRGIAGRMYEHAFGRLKALGMRFVKVNTGGDASHAPARRAYEKAGFNVALPGVTYFRKLEAARGNG
jgi:ribosomal protein S18 acetylase RimI-like enzyme